MGENLSSVLRQILPLLYIMMNNESVYDDDVMPYVWDDCKPSEDCLDVNGHKMPEILTILADKRFVMTVLLPLLVALSFLPNLKRLAPSIAAASFFMIISFVLIGLIITSNLPHGLVEWNSNHKTWQSMFEDVDWSMGAMATCVIMYSLEGDQLILPIESAMARPERFGAVLAVSMIIIGFWFSAFGSVCVLAFGNIDGGSITAYLLDYNDGLKSPLFLSSKQILLLSNCIVSLSLFFTYPLQLFPAIGLMGQIVAKFDCGAISNRKNHRTKADDNQIGSGELLSSSILSMDVEVDDGREKRIYPDTEQYIAPNELIGNESIDDESLAMIGDSIVLRACLVLSTFLMAIIIPHLKNLIAIAGAVTGSMTSLIIPPLCALKSIYIDEHLNKRIRAVLYLFNGLLLFAGLIYGILGTILSMKTIVQGS